MKYLWQFLLTSKTFIGTVILLTFLLILELIPGPATAFAASPTTTPVSTSGFSIRVTPDTQAISSNRTFTVDITITAPRAIRAWQIDLNFNPSQIQCTGISEGDFLKSYARAHGGSSLNAFPAAIDNIKGKITNIVYFLAGAGSGGPQGTGTLCTLTFTPNAQAKGISAITPMNVTLCDTNCVAVPSMTLTGANLGIGVDSTSIPAPSPSVMQYSNPSSPATGGTSSPLDSTTTIITDSASNITASSATLNAHLSNGNICMEGFVLDTVSHPSTPIDRFDPIVGNGGYDLWRWFQKDDTVDSIDKTLSDITMDGIINISDVGKVGLYWGLTVPNYYALYYLADVTRDGKVNISDVGKIGLYWGMTVTYSSYPSGSFSVDLSNPPLGSPLTLSPGTTYYYRAFAYGSDGWTWGNEVSFTTSQLQPPTNVMASDGAYTDKVQICWTAFAGATGYSVYRNTWNDSGNAALIGTTAATTYNDATAQANTTYWYWLKANISNFSSSFSISDAGWLQTANGPFDFYMNYYSSGDDYDSGWHWVGPTYQMYEQDYPGHNNIDTNTADFKIYTGEDDGFGNKYIAKIIFDTSYLVPDPNQVFTNEGMISPTFHFLQGPSPYDPTLQPNESGFLFEWDGNWYGNAINPGNYGDVRIVSQYQGLAYWWHNSDEYCQMICGKLNRMGGWPGFNPYFPSGDIQGFWLFRN